MQSNFNRRHLILFVFGIMCGISAAVGGKFLLGRWNDSSCSSEVTRLDSPNGQWTATQTYKQCGWGLGVSGDFATLRIDKQGPNGWFQKLELELDPDAFRAPTIKWKESNLLEVSIYSKAYSGTITRSENDLRLITTYVSK